MKTISLRGLRELANVTQAKAASEIGVDLRTYTRWESGDVTPAGGNLLMLQEWVEELRRMLEAPPIRWPWA